MPTAKPVSASEVRVFAPVIVTELKSTFAALVMLALFVTVTVVLTKYAVPISLLCTAIREVFEVIGVKIGAIPTAGDTASIVTVLVEATEKFKTLSMA